MRVLSLGAGVQSSTLLLMAVHGELQIDRAIFADTQWEPKEVYDWLGGLVLVAGAAGIPVETVTAGNLRDDSFSKPGWIMSLPLYVAGTETARPGILNRACTNGYKLRPLYRRIRELGATAKRPADVLVGISLDEAHRMKPARVQYIRNEWPLIDRRMTRGDCLLWMDRHGYSRPPKSACIACPFRDDASWRAMKDADGSEWADAVAFDQAARGMSQAKDRRDLFVHRSLMPLPMVDLSNQRDAGQTDMFDTECEGMCGV